MRDEGKLQHFAGTQTRWVDESMGRLSGLGGGMRRACQALNNFRVQGISLTLQGCEFEVFKKSP
jgi:hypothetical protein